MPRLLGVLAFMDPLHLSQSKKLRASIRRDAGKGNGLR
jgi:hypothetical protein